MPEITPAKKPKIIEVEVGNEIHEFPYGTSEEAMMKAIEASRPPAPPKEEPGFMSNLVSGTKNVVDQYNRGVEDTERMIGELVGVPMSERRTDTTAPKGIPQNIARFIGEYVSPVTPLAGLPAGGPLARAALHAKWLGSKAYLPVSTAAKKAYGVAGRAMAPVKDAASQVGSFLSSIPKESYKRALNNPSILKKNTSNEAYDELGKRAQDAINYVRKKAGKLVEEEANIVRSTKGNFNTDDTVKWIKDLLKEHHYGPRYSYNKKDGIREEVITTLTNPDRKLINTVISQIKGAPSAENILGVKRYIQNNIRFDPNQVKKTSRVGESILKLISERLGKSLEKINPNLKKVNQDYSSVMTAKDDIKRLTTDARIESFFKNYSQKPVHIQDQLSHIDKVAPTNLKFLKDLKDMGAAEKFKNIFPGQGGGSGGTEGAANLMRGGAFVGGASLNPALAPVIAPLFSPLAHNLGIRAGSAGVKAVKGAGSVVAKNERVQQVALRKILKALSEDENKFIDIHGQKKER